MPNPQARAAVALTSLAAVALAGCLAAPSPQPAALALPSEGWLPVAFDGVLHEFADIETPSGLRVHLDVWRPDPATYTGAEGGAEAPVPVVLHASPYFTGWKQGEERRPSSPVNDYIFEHLLPRGYAFAAAELPGTAGSTGCWDFMGPQEVEGTVAAVEWLGAQPWSNGKVGMVGLSYDGMTQIMALSEPPAALATAVPMAPLTHAYAGVYMNGVPYNGFWAGAWQYYGVENTMANPPLHTPERMQGYVERQPAQPLCAVESFEGGVANLGDYNAYYQARDFRPGAADIRVPVFWMQGFLDRNVKPDNTFPYLTDLGGPTMAWLGQWVHTFPNATFAGRADMYLALTRWFDRWLKDHANGIDQELGLHVQDSEGRWRREATWPPADARPVTLRLADGALRPEADATGGGAQFLDVAQPDSVCLLVDCFPVPAAPVPTSARWLGRGFEAETLVAGPVWLALNASSSGPRGHVVAILEDCLADGTDCRPVTRGAFNLLHRNDLERGEPLAQGEVASIGFALQPRDYVFLAGRAPLLVLAGDDGVDWFQPEPTRNILTIHESADLPGTVSFPVASRDPAQAYLVGCGIFLEAQGRDCRDETLEDRYPEAPAS